MRRSLTIVAAALLAGCYSYIPIERGTLVPGTLVRARLSVPGAIRLSESIGEIQRSVEGQVVHVRPDALLVAVRVRDPYGGHGFRGAAPKLDTLQVPEGDIAELEEKRFSTLKTGAVLGAAGAISAFVVIRLFDLAGGGGGGPDGGSPDAYRAVPLPGVRP